MILVPTSICARASGPSGSSADQRQPPAPIGDKSFRTRRGLIPYPGRQRLFSRVVAGGAGLKDQGGRLNLGRGIGRPAPHAPEPAAFTRTGLSAVTLEPLRPRAAHIVPLRSIAAVRQGGSDGPENGQ